METTTAITWTPILGTGHQEADLEGIFRAQVGPIAGVWPWFVTAIGDDENVTSGTAATEDEAKAAVAAWVDSPKSALESIRLSLRNECISMGELAMLQNELVEYIEPGDIELLEAAGVPEYPEPAVWNVVSTVVALVEAPTAAEAQAKLNAKIEGAGLTIHDDSCFASEPFLSEFGAEADL